jgi:hypothetical protein
MSRRPVGSGAPIRLEAIELDFRLLRPLDEPMIGGAGGMGRRDLFLSIDLPSGPLLGTCLD